MIEAKLLITINDRKAGYCTNTCWASTHTQCYCACKGLNHGLGAPAVQARSLKQLAIDLRPLYQSTSVKVIRIPGQLRLF